MSVPVGRVRAVRPDEAEAWCACPLGEDDPRFVAWSSGERSWLKRWHRGPGDSFANGNLFAYAAKGRFLGKYDVPQETSRMWTLWGPSACDGPATDTVLDALCAHVLAEAARRGVAVVEVFVEEAHRQRERVTRALQRTGFRLHERRVVVTRDIAGDLEPVPDTGLSFGSTDELGDAEMRRLRERTGAHPESLRQVPGVIARQAGAPVGLTLRTSAPGDDVVTLQYLGLVPEVRGRGHGRALLLTVLSRARDEGATRYVGCTALTNTAMLRVFERTGCSVVGTRHVYIATPSGDPPAGD